MVSFSSANELEKELKEVGNSLSVPPSSINELLDLLDKVEHLLSVVGQAPSNSMQGALVPSMGALISDELLRHSDVDVRVSVASCISEITRITAPDAPYNDDVMKEIFQLNVIAFGKLSHVSGRCYSKAIHIVDSVARVKSCLLMLDLECDALIFQMFQQFLCTIRSNHPHALFSDMETIMTLVIEESEEIPTELLSLLLSHVKKENQIVSPIPWKLVEKVLRNCADILKPYVQEVVESMSLDPDNYADVVVSLCQDAPPKELVENLRRAQVQEKASQSANLGSKEKCKGKGPNAKLQRCSGKTEVVAKTNMVKTHAQNNVVIKKEDEVLHDSEGRGEPSFLQMNHKNCSSGKTTSRKHVAKGSGDKILASPSATIPSRGKKHCNEASKKKCKRKWTLTKEEDSKASCNIKEHGEELVGHRIKVWWPLDQMFYEGAVSSFDALEKKHKVLYADGDEEVLNLSEEQWELVGDILPDREDADLPNPSALSDKHWKKKDKRKAESSVKEDNVSFLLKRAGTSASVSKIEAAKHDITVRGTDDSTISTLCVVDNSKDDVTEKHRMLAKLKQDSESPASEEHILSQEGPSESGDLESLNMLDSANKPEESETRSAKRRRRLVKVQEFVSQL